MKIIPFHEPSSWKQQIELTGVVFILRFHWNALNEFWALEIYDASEDPIILGVKIVPSYPLLNPFATIEKPAGEIICQNIVAGPSIIKRFDMSQKFELVYYEPGELQELIDQASGA